MDNFLLACVGRARGSKVSWAELYTRYRRWCADRQSEPVDAVKFGRQLDALRSEGVLRARRQGADVLCVDVKLIA